MAAANLWANVTSIQSEPCVAFSITAAIPADLARAKSTGACQWLRSTTTSDVIGGK